MQSIQQYLSNDDFINYILDLLALNAVSLTATYQTGVIKKLVFHHIQKDCIVVKRTYSDNSEDIELCNRSTFKSYLLSLEPTNPKFTSTWLSPTECFFNYCRCIRALLDIQTSSTDCQIVTFKDKGIQFILDKTADTLYLTKLDGKPYYINTKSPIEVSSIIDIDLFQLQTLSCLDLNPFHLLTLSDATVTSTTAFNKDVSDMYNALTKELEVYSALRKSTANVSTIKHWLEKDDTDVSAFYYPPIVRTLDDIILTIQDILGKTNTALLEDHLEDIDFETIRLDLLLYRTDVMKFLK